MRTVGCSTSCGHDTLAFAKYSCTARLMHSESSGKRVEESMAEQRYVLAHRTRGMGPTCQCDKQHYQQGSKSAMFDRIESGGDDRRAQEQVGDSIGPSDDD